MKLASYFYQQAVDLSESVASPRLKAKVLAKQIDLCRATNRVDDFHESLDQLKSIASTVRALLRLCRCTVLMCGLETCVQEGGLSSIEILDFDSQMASEAADFETAAQTSSSALTSLKKLNKAFVDNELQFTRSA